MATVMLPRMRWPQMPSKCCYGTCKAVAGQDAVSLQLVHAVCAAADDLYSCSVSCKIDNQHMQHTGLLAWTLSSPV